MSRAQDHMDNVDDKTYGMLWVLAHWLLPVKATKADALALLDKAHDEYVTGINISDNPDW